MAEHIGYVLKRFPRLSQTFVLGELLELQRRGARLTVLAARGCGEPAVHPDVARLLAPVHYLPGPDLPAAAAGLPGLLGAAGITHLHAHFATWAARAAARATAETGIPFSLTAHATDIHRSDHDADVLAATLAAARFVVTVSEANRRHLAGLLGQRGLPGDVRRLYNGVDTRRLRQRPGTGLPGLVVAVGRLVEKKGFADLISAFATVHRRDAGLRCVIIGEGPERAALERLRDGLGLREVVELPGTLPHAQVLAAVAQAAVFALPCVIGADGDRDGLPTVLLEAMALGTPVVSTDLPGIPEMIDDGVSGAVVPRHHPAALAAALGRVIDDPGTGARWAAAARARVERDFDLATNVATLHGWFAGAPR